MAVLRLKSWFKEPMIIEQRCPTCERFLTIVGSDDADILRRVKAREGEVFCAHCDSKRKLNEEENIQIEINLSKTLGQR
jgi:uncharacterized Zn finger protein (UPF0148 family)